MALEIVALIFFVVLLWINHEQRAREPKLWQIWLAVRRGRHAGLDAHEARLAHELERMVNAGVDAFRAHATGDAGRVRGSLTALRLALGRWSLDLSAHLFMTLAWWATLRATLDVRPLDPTLLQVGRLRALARAEATLLGLLPRALWLEWHVRVLSAAVLLLPGVFRRLDPPRARRPWARLLAAVEDLEHVGYEALDTARRLRASLMTAQGGMLN
jgi:hypothetical protein